MLTRHTGTDKSISSLQSTGRRYEGFCDIAGWLRLYLYSGLKTKIRVPFYYPGKSGNLITSADNCYLLPNFASSQQRNPQTGQQKTGKRLAGLKSLCRSIQMVASQFRVKT